MNQERIETFAGMLEVGVARLRRTDLTLAEKQKTLEAMRGLSNKLAQEIQEHRLDTQPI
jgi:NifB/MoaA-like Fe-S oxidoreductase